ncbi:hypothetical protein VCRA2116O427_150056 [Vibrio crassostreae]|nr:hypothetical protein VCRA2113O412_140056 [Vibrio crassostreae]CAK1766649.1 hypothetical protein VCRA2113O414_140056 [Vibrio crassostreae]CAK1768137.1 hypothetical protein VCRA2113O418_140056 [Vibrio crassostreae]CAK1783122.1 hypothetical protein VCRA2113O413_150047 [Vibrio crassostreae]CAK1783231.1 hypothetical protein VCRA2114O423_150047 [Vibrio crassostreae]
MEVVRQYLIFDLENSYTLLMLHRIDAFYMLPSILTYIFCFISQ